MASSITADNWVQQYQIILPTDGEPFVSECQIKKCD